MPIAGFSRQRRWYFGKQTVHGTAVTVTRALPFSGTLDVQPNWTDITDTDLGSIDFMLPAYRTQTDVTANLSMPQLSYQDIPLLMAAAVRGGQTPVLASSTYQWTHQSLSTTATSLDEFTTEWADDVTSDGFRAKDGIIETLELGFDESLGPWTATANWRYGSVDGGVTPATGLLVGSNLPLVYGADTRLYVDNTSGGIGVTQISDALHRASITITNEIDVKRFANGSNTRFAVAGYGLTGRTITASFTFAKTSQTVGLASEAAKWLSADPTNRYVQLDATSSSIISGAIPYSLQLRFSGTWRTRTDETVGGNSVVVLEMTGRYDAGLGYAFRSYCVNSLSGLP